MQSTESEHSNELNAALLTAHDRGDRLALVRLYHQAGTQNEAAGDIDAACFYYTHAYVFALEAGLPIAIDIKKTLVRFGREE